MKIEVLENNIRLDNYLIDKIDSSRSKIQKLIKNNSILVNNKNTKNNIIKDNYYIFKDKKDKILDKLSDLITS